MDAKLFKIIVMELRPRLQSVNVFITFENDSKDIQIELDTNSFRIVHGDRINVIKCNFSIVPNSMSSFCKQNTHVNFRLATNDADLGSTKCELIQSQCTNFEYSEPSVPIILTNDVYRLQCVNCRSVLCELEFDRVLPLPTENLETNDWFCHAPVGFNLNTAPCEKDIFYKDECAHIHSDNLDNVVQKESVFFCKRCSTWLGVKIAKKTFKLWFHTVALNELQTDVLQDVYSVMKRLLHEHFTTSARFILSCQTDQDERNYLLVWVMEKKLLIQMQEQNNEQNKYVAKVLFRFEEAFNSAVEEWFKNLAINKAEISKPMMDRLLQELHKVNEYFPSDFAWSNEFVVSYLPLYTVEEK